LQELIDKMQTSLAAQRSATRRLLAASGLPPVSEADDAAHNSLNEVIDEWTAHVRPVTGRSSPLQLFCFASPPVRWWLLRIHGERW
jgi:hypothetical protein